METTRAVYHAWCLARAHGHHWASSAAPEALAYGRAILAGDPNTLAAAQAAYDDWAARPSEGSVPPKTIEEAKALSALPAGPIGGIEFSFEHRTQSGRLGWSVDPRTGAIEITVYRPGSRPCLILQIDGTLRRVTIDLGPAPVRARHVAAVNRCLAALGIPELSPGDALLADDAGRTPAWWTLHEMHAA